MRNMIENRDDENGAALAIRHRSIGERNSTGTGVSQRTVAKNFLNKSSYSVIGGANVWKISISRQSGGMERGIPRMNGGKKEINCLDTNPG